MTAHDATHTPHDTAAAPLMVRLALPCALITGAILRIAFTLGSSFPLNDGGLFYLMARELQRARYALPAFTAYNRAGIPFAYPPLGLYLAALLDAAGPWSLLDLFRWLPPALSIAAIAAFYPLARALLRSQAAAGYAVIALALLPGAFMWQVMGGGITRSLGFLFMTLALHRALLLYTQPQRKHLLLAVLFAGATLLSHLAMALATAAGFALLFLAYGRSRAGLRNSAIVAAGTLALSAPWWVTVTLRHGLGPLLAAGNSPEPTFVGVYYLVLLQLTDEPFFPLLGALALLGVLACLARRRYLLPAWLAAIYLLDPRTARTTATLPLALLVSAGMEGLLPVLAAAARPSPRNARRLALIGGAFGLLFALISAHQACLPFLSALSPAEREAMAWVSAHTPEDSAFVVITGNNAWGADRTSEWFPVLAERRSAATVQGTEWQPGFARRTDSYLALQQCAGQGLSCLETWVREGGVSPTHIYIAKRPSMGSDSSRALCSALLEALRSSAQYRIVYEGEGAVVLQIESAMAAPGRQGGRDG